MNNNLLAVMVLTHNHSETIEFILDKNLEQYKKHGIDVYICDDSDDDRTKKITESYIEKGYDNLYFADSHGVKNGDEKYFEIAKKTFALKEYKYIFPLKDRASFSDRIIEMIAKEVEKDFDVIMVVNDFERWEIKLPPIQDIYLDATEFFNHYGQLTTNWRSMIYNTNTILNDDNIIEFEEKYGAGANLPFNQTTITFAGLANIKEPRIRVIHASFSGDAEETSEFGAGSGWLKEVFELWIDKWTKAIFGLPEIYNPYKASVVKAETNLNVLFGSVDGLLAHKGRGVLTKEVFQKYRGIWGMISNVPVEWVDFILEEKYDVLYASVFSKIENCLKSEDYDNAFYYTMQNKWLEEVNDDFKKVNYIMYLYRLDKFSQGESTRLNGVHSIQELIKLTEAN